MQVYKIGIAEVVIAPLASRLKSALSEGPTLWLLSGGSNIKISVGVMQQIDSYLSNNLIIALADERFGPYNHQDSNWAQLMNAGFEVKNSTLIETLKPGDNTLSSTVLRYSNELSIAMDQCNYLVGQLGLGQDGHIAGILPNTIATTETDELVIGYENDPFTRITVTFTGLRRLSSLFLIATGENKRDQLNTLINQDLSLSVQPAQIIKQIEDSYLYNDQLEGK